MKPALVLPDTQVAPSILYHCVSTSLALLSPFMPFITEELWQRLPRAAAHSALCLQPYPRSAQLVGRLVSCVTLWCSPVMQ